MRHRVGIVVLMLLAAAPMFAQVPKGWMYRVDRSTQASDPDAPGDIKLIPAGSGLRAIDPQAAIYWKPAGKVTGSYTLKGTFTLLQNTGNVEYYGLMFGGSDLAGAGQNYLYFIVAPDGTWLIKRRTGDSTESLSEKTPSNAVKQPDASGRCTNRLEVRVGAGKIEFLVNGTLVDTLPKTGQAAKTDGIYGFRVNHHLKVQVNGFGVSKP
ncbi:MAG TPA: hypothetical protein VNJ52_02760 [Patescibacteria group bacterium]|nr:hypothetical protein [Patescibacteria group bacterium]